LKFFLFDGSGQSTKSHEASQNTGLLRAVHVTSWIVLFISTKEVGAVIETDRLPASEVRTGSNSDRVAVDLSNGRQPGRR